MGRFLFTILSLIYIIVTPSEPICVWHGCCHLTKPTCNLVVIVTVIVTFIAIIIVNILFIALIDAVVNNSSTSKMSDIIIVIIFIIETTVNVSCLLHLVQSVDP